MEELVGLLIQLLFEVVLPVLGSIPVDRSLNRRGRNQESTFLFVNAAAGVLVGLLSLVIYPHLLLPQPWMRIAALIVNPLLSGGLAVLVGGLVLPSHHQVSRSSRFWHAALFAFLIGSLRFLFADR